MLDSWEVLEAGAVHMPGRESLGCPSLGTMNTAINANKAKPLRFSWRLIPGKDSVVIGPSWIFHAIVQTHQEFYPGCVPGRDK